MGKTLGVTFAVGASMGGTVASTFATVDSRVKALKTNLKDLQTVSAKAGALMTADAQLKAAQAAYKANPTAELNKAMQSAQKGYNSAERAAKKYNLTVAESAKVHAQTTAAIAKQESALSRMQKMQANQEKRKELQGQMLGTVATFATVALPVKLSIDFQDSFADVKKVIDFASAEEEKAVQQDIRELSSKTGLAATGIAGIYAAAGEAKLATTREELQNFAETAAKMAVAYGISAEDAGQKMASWRSKMGMSQQEVVALSDAMNHLGNNMAAKAPQTAAVVERMGAVAKSAGLSAKSIAALSATFVAASPAPEQAATGMKNFLLAMIKGDSLSKDQKSVLSKLGIKNPKELAVAMQKDAEGTIVMVMEAIARMPEAQHGAILSELFGSESFGAIAPLLKNLGMLKKSFRIVAKEQDYTGSMNDEYVKRSQTAQAALARLRRTAESLGIGLGSTVLPGIVAVANATMFLLSPVISLAERFPLVTTTVMAVTMGLVALKVVALGGAYAGTILSDGWGIAKNIFASLHPKVIANKVALLAHNVASKASAASTWLCTAAQKAHSVALALSKPKVVASTVAMVAHKAVALALAAGTKIMTVAQWALNVAMTANPIGLVVVAVAALAAGLYWLYNNCAPVRTAIDAVWKVMKIVGLNAVRLVFLPMAIAWNLIKAVWGPVSAFFSKIWTAVTSAAAQAWGEVKAVWTRVSDFFGGIWGSVKARAESAWSGIGESIGGVWESLKAPAVAVFDWIGSKFEWLSGKFQWIAEGWTTVKGWFGDEEEENKGKARANPDQQTVASSAAAAPTTAVNPSSGAVAASPRAVATSGGTPAPLGQSAKSLSSSPGSSASAGMPSVSISIPVTITGVPAADIGKVLVQAIKGQERELEAYFNKFLERIAANQKRLAYGS